MSERHPFIYNEFDIEAARNAGKCSEQERIIKLLTDLANEIQSDYCCAEDDGNRLHGIAEAIALIKGEK